MKERILDLKKDDECIVAVEERSNESRHRDMSIENIDNWTYKGIVTKVTKKYITVEYKIHGVTQVDKFSIENNYKRKYTYGTADFELYKDLQEIKDIKEADRLRDKIFGCSYDRREFVNNLSLEKLREINSIIERKE